MAGLDGNKTGDPKSTRLSRFSEILGTAHEKLGTQVSESADIQKSEHSNTKIAKRNRTDYTQVSFRIPKQLSRQIDRAILDLQDADIECDRSDLLEIFATAFLKLAKVKGAQAAFDSFKAMGDINED